MTQPHSRCFTVLFCLTLSSFSASGQITIDTFAGGVVPSDVSAQDVAFGTITGVTRDLKGNLVFCDTTTSVIRRINADGTIQTIAGVGVPGYGGDGGPATHAVLNSPAYPKYDASGNLFFADIDSFRIRRVDPSGVITTVAGTGIMGILGADGPANQAQVGIVEDLAVDKSGNVYIADHNQDGARVRRITPAGRIGTYAGCPTCSGDVDGTPATHAEFSSITAIASDQKGNLYLSDGFHILYVSPDGILHNFAGFGTASNMGNGGPALNAPISNCIRLATDSSGDVYTEERPFTMTPVGTIESTGFIIRRVGTDGIVNILAGTATSSGIEGTGPALQTYLIATAGSGFVIDPGGTITFAENYHLRQLTSQATITTLAPKNARPAADGTKALDAEFVQPNSIAFDGAGNLYVGQSCVIQKIDSQGVVSRIAGTAECSAIQASGPALTTQLAGVFSIAVDKQGQVFFANSATTGHVYEVSTAGMISEVAAVGQPTDGISPQIAVDSKDNIYYSSYFGHLFRISPGSTPDNATVTGVDSLFPVFYNAIAIDSSDNVYVCCGPAQGLFDHPIYRYSPDLKRTVAGTAIPPVSALAVGASSNIWQGSLVGLYKGEIPFGASCCSSYGDGEPAESAYIGTSAMAFAPSGDLYVLDANTGRIRRIHGSPPMVRPVISAGGIVNAASLAGTAIAPGELVSIFGTNFGPSGLDVSSPQNNVIPRALNNIHVYFGARNEGAITARTPNQINVFVPYNVAKQTSVQVTVDVDGVLSDPISMPVAPSAFGLSTHDGSGSGQGAIFNQDFSLNSDSNPAARGSIVVLFGTGEGVTTPALPDGALEISTPYSSTQAPVIVKFGGETAEITYDGAAPLLPTGVFQINATIPMDVTPGDVPITVSIGGIETTRKVTVAVQ
ncbi:MAG TPA: hypothetical protein VMH80_06510 [Bryobacteraceae bacterium]|nr:hypothetical protein [Bryobacteraceae bacterium]